MASIVAITIDDFKSYFARDFTYSETLPDITENDIQKAIDEANLTFNFDLYPDPTINDIMKTALLYLIAHYLLLNTDSADTGGQSQFLVNSKSVGGISVSYDIPDWMKQGESAQFATTYYGQKFLMLSKPYLDGLVLTVSGMTQY
jgi:hypothetical protein